ncbi:ATP-binding protein [Melioribacteraceae bacterium 4301-Me]|uniref:sensor histidine kinase n=1 Tax=Pyranulibacter aquaticus TaxID=3163344 RepID=UPI0035974936
MKKKHLEEKENLRLQQAELMALFAELSPDPIFRFDHTGKIILANNAAHKLFHRRNVLGENVKELLSFVSDIDIDNLITETRQITNTMIVDERYYQFILTGVAKFNMCHVYGRDITDLKKKETELKEALARAEEAKKIKENFLAQISHEIRSPLNAIEGYAEYLMDELKQEKREELVDIFRSIKNSSKRLYRTFDLLLNMSQVQTGRYDVRFEKVNIYALLKTLFIEFKSMAEEKKLAFSLVNKGDENPIAYVDHYSIVQVFANLIDNAIKFTNEGEVEIIISQEDSNVCVDIRDTGIGISENYLKNIYTPFSQEQTGYTRAYDGTGLGLALVKSFLDLNRARIKVQTQVNKGTTFRVVLNGEKKWKTQ